MTAKKTLAGILVSFGGRIFSRVELQAAWRKINYPGQQLRSPMGWVAYAGLHTAKSVGILDNVLRSFIDTEPVVAQQHGGRTLFDSKYINEKLNQVYNMPDVKVDRSRPTTINVLVPAFEFRSISAGFFGVFQVARFLRTTGLNVRLVLFDRFHFDLAECKQKFLHYPGLEHLLDEVELEYIGERKAPLLVSEHDTCVATVWYSAHFAKKIMSHLGKRPFIYLIQDYETHFFPGNTLFALADETYGYDYIALFSTTSLRDLFLKRDIGGIRTRQIPYIHFNNACAANLPSRQEFHRINSQKPKKRLVFYSRPIVDRNMFELTALALMTAYREGIFNADEWECIGMGLGEGTVELLPGVHSISLPRMTLAEYTEAVSGFDICLTLMASPHPSLIPMDLAGSGTVVVTNTFETKTPDYLTEISKNIIPCKPCLEELVIGLCAAKDRVADLDARYNNAAAMNYPRDWSQSLSTEHAAFFKNQLGIECKTAEKVIELDWAAP
jgi:hypothetical protein